MRALCAAVLAMIVPQVAAPAQAATIIEDHAWFEEPCLPDTADSFFWTRYDLQGIRIRIPPGVRHVKVPSLDELHFRYGQAWMQLRMARDASKLFAAHYTPDLKRRHCSGDIGGLIAEVISLGPPGYGFAARWPDADRGEWLAVVIQGSRLAEVTYLRRALFTIVFPDERR